MKAGPAFAPIQPASKQPKQSITQSMSHSTTTLSSPFSLSLSTPRLVSSTLHTVVVARNTATQAKEGEGRHDTPSQAESIKPSQAKPSQAPPATRRNEGRGEAGGGVTASSPVCKVLYYEGINLSISIHGQATEIPLNRSRKVPRTLRPFTTHRKCPSFRRIKLLEPRMTDTIVP